MANENAVPETPQNPNATSPVSPAAQTEKETNKDARLWGMLAHLTALSGVFTGGIGSIVGPLVIWLIKKEELPFVNEQGKESLNFQITMFIYAIVAFLLTFVCIGMILLPAVGIVDLVFVIIATIKANDGVHYRYPKGLIFRFIK